MLELQLYESPHVEHSLACANIHIPVTGPITWAAQGHTIVACGLHYQVEQLSPRVSKNDLGSYIHATARYTGDNAARSGYASFAQKIAGQWHGYLTRAITGEKWQVSIGDEDGALSEVDRIAELLGICTK